MTNYVNLKWGDVCTLEYGKGIRDYKNLDAKYAVYASAGKVGTFDNFLSKEGVIVSRKGTLSVYYSAKPFYVIDTAFWLKPKPMLNSKWAYYSLLNFDIKKLISGSSVPSLSRNDFYNTDLLLPKINIQKSIASFLSKFDEKIELNKKLNQTLLKIAKTLFKSWFIDFDPVKAKVDNKKTGLIKEISDLFPNSFENSTYNKIPNGWKMVKISDCFDTVIGGTPSRRNKEFWKGKNGWINSGAVNEFPLITPSEYISDTATEKSSTKFSKKKSTLIALVTAINKGLITFSEIDVFINQSIVAIQPDDIFFPEYIYLYTNHNYKRLYREQSGGAQQHINKNIVNNFEILKPSDEILISFKNLFKNIFEKIALNAKENIILSDLRDTIMPKIFLGKLKIPDVEKIVDRISS